MSAPLPIAEFRAGFALLGASLARPNTLPILAVWHCWAETNQRRGSRNGLASRPLRTAVPVTFVVEADLAPLAGVPHPQPLYVKGVEVLVDPPLNLHRLPYLAG